MKESKRTYYGWQLGEPTLGPLDFISAQKSPTYQVKCRARSVAEAREILNQKWADQCNEAMEKESHGRKN